MHGATRHSIPWGILNTSGLCVKLCLPPAGLAFFLGQSAQHLAQQSVLITLHRSQLRGLALRGRHLARFSTCMARGPLRSTISWPLWPPHPTPTDLSGRSSTAREAQRESVAFVSKSGLHRGLTRQTPSLLLRPLLDTPPKGQYLGCSSEGPIASQRPEVSRASGHVSSEGRGRMGPPCHWGRVLTASTPGDLAQARTKAHAGEAAGSLGRSPAPCCPTAGP